MSNELDKALIARSRKERRKNINKLFGSLSEAKYTIIYKPFSKSKWLEVLKYLEDMDHALTLLLGAGWMNGETNPGEDEAKKSGDITALTVSRLLQLGLLNAHAAQIEATGKTLAWILARLNGESFPGVLAGAPNNEELVDLLGVVHEQLGDINKVAVLMQRGYVLNARDMDGTAKQWFEDRCRAVINNSIQPAGGK
jgi:hypothetical protein